MPSRVVDPRVVALGIGVPLAILLAVVVSMGRDDGEPGATTTQAPVVEPGSATVDQAWNDELAEALSPLSTALVDLASTVDAWSTGDVGDDDLRAVLDRTAPVLERVRSASEALDDHPDDPLARQLVVEMAELYVRAAEAHRLALATSDDIRREYDHLGRRLRILADRIFDRARERTSVPVDPGPDVSLVLPAEVPDWERLEIAAGPPLVGRDPNRSDQLPRSREDDRASQPEGTWLDVLAALGVPTADEVRAVLDDAAELDRLAQRLVAAAESLRAVPVPDGDRSRADRVALGWLVRADGARAGQLAVLDDRAGVELAEALLDVSSGEVFRPG